MRLNPLLQRRPDRNHLWLVAGANATIGRDSDRKVLAFIASHNRLMRADGARCIVTIRNAQRASVQDRR
jgi:hypothetical protein